MRADPAQRLKNVRHAAVISLAVTAVVVAAKLSAAVLTHSVSILAESMQSLVDVVMSSVAIIAVSFAARPADEDHPHGHGRLEVLSGALQMVIVIASAGVIAWQAAIRLVDARPIEPDLGIVVMVGAALVNVVTVAYLRRVGNEHSSASLIAESAHLRSDTYASIGIIIGLIATKITGWYVLDPIFALAFTVAGAVFAVRELIHLGHQLMDGALPAAELASVRHLLEAHPHVKGYHNMMSRRAGELRIITLHILLDDELTFVEAHDIAEQVESELSAHLGGALVTAHYEPNNYEMAHRAAFHRQDT